MRTTPFQSDDHNEPLQGNLFPDPEDTMPPSLDATNALPSAFGDLSFEKRPESLASEAATDEGSLKQSLIRLNQLERLAPFGAPMTSLEIKMRLSSGDEQEVEANIQYHIQTGGTRIAVVSGFGGVMSIMGGHMATILRGVLTKMELPKLGIEDMYLSDILAPLTYAPAMVAAQFGLCILGTLLPKLNTNLLKSSEVTALTMFLGASGFELRQFLGIEAGVADPRDFLAYGIGSMLTYFVHKRFIAPIFSKFSAYTDAIRSERDKGGAHAP